jgi:hypothetical protein
MAATISFNLAEYYHTHNNLEKAQSFYNEALRHDETHEQVTFLNLFVTYPGT